MHPDLTVKVEAEVDRLVNVGHLRSTILYLLGQHSPGQEKERADSICIDFWDLNKACSKDDFLVPHMQFYRCNNWLPGIIFNGWVPGTQLDQNASS